MRQVGYGAEYLRQFDFRLTLEHYARGSYERGGGNGVVEYIRAAGVEGVSIVP